MLSKISSYLLDIPIIYNLTQKIFAPGANKRIIHEINSIIKKLPYAESYLDVGCCPKSILWKSGIKPIGLDVSTKYINEYNKISNNSGIVGKSDSIPLGNESFDSIWSFGLFHHISDKVVKLSLKEMLRVCKEKGHLIIFDAVLPKSYINKPIAWLIRKADRGRYMRNEKELLFIISNNSNIIYQQRITYSYTGLEALIIIIKK